MLIGPSSETRGWCLSTSVTQITIFYINHLRALETHIWIKWNEPDSLDVGWKVKKIGKLSPSFYICFLQEWNTTGKINKGRI